MNIHIQRITEAREASPFHDYDLNHALHSAIDAGEDLGYSLAVALARTPTPAEVDALVAERREAACTAARRAEDYGL